MDKFITQTTVVCYRCKEYCDIYGDGTHKCSKCYVQCPKCGRYVHTLKNNSEGVCGFCFNKYHRGIKQDKIDFAMKKQFDEKEAYAKKNFYRKFPHLLKTYYCTKCERKHFRGDVFIKHSIHRKELSEGKS